MNNKRWHSLQILNDGRSALCEEKFSQFNGTRILPGKCRSTVRRFLKVHSNNDYLVTRFSGFVLPALKFQQDRLSRHVL